jgi:hypothetical protein
MLSEIIRDTDPIPPREVIGTKQYNLMKMKQAGIPVPPFFTILSDGTADTLLHPNIIEEATKLGQRIIVRSAHLNESGKHPFSGVFNSQACSVSNMQREYTSLREQPYNETTTDYLQKHRIVEFNPTQMHAVVMPFIPHRYFSMFMTSTQNDPNVMIINQYDNKEGIGGWEKFSKKRRNIFGAKIKDESLLRAYALLGNLGIKIEQLFDKPMQLEAAVMGDQVYAFQAKEIHVDLVPSHAFYKTMQTGLSCDGACEFSGKVLVLGVDNSICVDQYAEIAQQHMEKARTFIAHEKEYALVLNNVEYLLNDNEKGYSFLNEVVQRAKVQLRSTAQSVLRHNAWEHIEKHGAIIYLSDKRMGVRIENLGDKFTTDDSDTYTREPFVIGKEAIKCASGIIPIDIMYRSPIHTGETINVIANRDGVFIW